MTGKSKPKGETSMPGERQRYALLSHDLRSALADVVGGLHLIDISGFDEQSRVQLDRVAAAGETLGRLLDSILSDEVDQPALTTPPASNIDLSEFLIDTRRRWEGQAREKGIGFDVKSEAMLPAVITLDRVAIDRVIGNLISNAIKNTDEGTVTLKVFCRGGDELCFCVEDDGTGFSADALEHLFEYEGRPQQAAKPGSGLGLFIAKELADLLAGKLEVGNKEEGGARVILRLPHPSWFDRTLRRGKSPKQAAVDLTGVKILLAEDNLTNQLVATQMLTFLGAEVIIAADGVEALACLNGQTFDLALLDIEMPRMTGIEVIEKLRAGKGSTSQMPLVALTAYVMREHRDRIYGAGADGIIAKPLMSAEALGQAVLSHLLGKDEAASERSLEAAVKITELDKKGIHTVVDRGIFDSLVTTIGAASAEELLGKIQTDTDSVAEGIALGKHHLNSVELRAQTHILISVAGAIGAVRLQHIAEQLNAAANRNAAREIDTLCDSCLSGLADLQAFISDEQNKYVAAD